jgi:hypothetical protein
MVRLALLVLSGILTTGCFVSADTHAARGSGALGVDWTIHGAKDPDLCALSGAADIDISLVRSDGFAADYVERCEAFFTAIELTSGRYSGYALLVDAGGADRTTQVDLGSFEILGGDTLRVPIDFPAASFY